MATRKRRTQKKRTGEKKKFQGRTLILLSAWGNIEETHYILLSSFLNIEIDSRHGEGDSENNRKIESGFPLRYSKNDF